MKRRFGLIMLGASVLLLTGCSSDEPGYEYAVPGDICGVKVDPSDLKPLLPPGEKVRERSSDGVLGPGAGRGCSVVVDEGPDLTVSISRQGGRLDIAREASDKYVDLRRVSLGESVTSAAVGEDGAVAWMACVPKPGQPRYESPETKTGQYGHLSLEIHIGDDIERSGPVEEWRTHIENLLRAYVPGLMGKWCA